jgi:hypothetical protein
MFSTGFNENETTFLQHFTVFLSQGRFVKKLKNKIRKLNPRK